VLFWFGLYFILPKGDLLQMLGQTITILKI